MRGKSDDTPLAPIATCRNAKLQRVENEIMHKRGMRKKLEVSYSLIECIRFFRRHVLQKGKLYYRLM